MQMIFRSSWLRIVGAVALASLFARPGFAQGPAADRIVRAVDSTQMAALRGNVHPLARPEFDQGDADSATVLPRVTMFFKLTASQQASLDALLAEQQDRSSPNYHRWLTPEQFGERFGVSAADLAKVVAWLQGQGFTVVETARGRNWVTFAGTAQQVSAALRTSIHRYNVNGEMHFANATEPSVPAALADVVSGFRGLDDFRLPARAIHKSPLSVQPNFTSGTSGRHFVTPGDFATIYDLNALYNNGIDGTGQKIAVVGQTDINLSDIQAFRTAAGLPPNVPQVVLVGTDTGTNSTDVVEADLDVEWSGAIAKNATIIYVNSTNVLNSMQSAVNQNLAPVISISYGGCEQGFGNAGGNALAAIAQQANAQGITIVAAAGDDGATDCDTTAPATHGLAVDLPASLPYVTGIGGTEFNEGSGTYWQAATNNQDVISSALSYIPEVSWNQTPASGTILASTGGASTLFSKPTWQTGTGVPNDGHRDVPDVSFNAAPDPDGYLICSQGWCTNGFRNSGGFLDEIGGTSAGAPTFAGVVALINQQTQAAGQGNINYTLYALAANFASAFHDITSGSNKVPCTSGSTDCPTGTATIGFTAGTGYDQVTGLGTPDINNMVTAWTAVSSTSLSQSNGGSQDFQFAISPATMTVARGNSGTAQVGVTPLNGFSGTPAFTCSVGAALTGVTCSVAPNAGGYKLTVTAGQNAGFYRPGFVNGNPWWLTIVLVLTTTLIYAARKRLGEVRTPTTAAWNGRAPGGTLALVTLVAICIGCSGLSRGSSTEAPSTNLPVSVTLTPPTVTLSQGQQQPFVASVQNSSNQSVTWSISPAVGSISSQGGYTAPATVTAAQAVTVTATSVADPTKQATSTITLLPIGSVAVTPGSVRLAQGQQQQFTASIQSSSNQSVTWSISPAVGSISSQGVYTAPSTIAATQEVTVTATSVADQSLTGTALVTLVPPITSNVTVTGTSGSISHTAQITVTVN